MMKKLIWILILALCLSGCSIISLKDTSAEQPAATEQPAAPEAPQETPEAPLDPQEPEEPAYDPIVLLSLGQVRVTVTDFLPDAPGGPVLQLEVKNDTSSDLTFRSGHASIGGVMCDPYWECAAAAGETVESQLWWGTDRLAARGIAALRDIRMELTVAGNEFVLFDDILEFSPAEGEGNAVQELQFPDFPAQVLAQTDAFTVTALNYAEGRLLLEIRNQTAHELLCAVTDVTADGDAFDPQWAALIMADALCLSNVEFPAELQPAEITMTLCLYDNTDRSSPTLFSETVTVTVP